MKVAVVGAGLAGLTCAKVLAEQGVEVEVFEASDGVGGRVRTDEKDGFLLDRGFQVYFTAYPAAGRNLDLAALDLRSFDPGAIVFRNGRRGVISDPRRDPGALLPSLLSTSATPLDKLKTVRLAAGGPADGAQAVAEVGDGDVSAYDYLRREGFSGRFIDSFFRPFYGGIFLDRSLSISSRVFRFTFGMMASGNTAVPARGMGEIPSQLGARLPEGSVHLESPVEGLSWDGDTVTGVRAAGGERDADAVVVATDALAAKRLAGEEIPEDFVGQLCIYYAAERPDALGSGRKIILNAEDGGFINNVVETSNVSRSYAPPGRGLVSAVALGGFELPDEEIYRKGLKELGDIAPNAAFEPLAVYRIPYAQFAQPPGIHEKLPAGRTATPGLFLAGEYTQDSSINGAMLSGERTAGEVISG